MGFELCLVCYQQCQCPLACKRMPQIRCNTFRWCLARCIVRQNEYLFSKVAGHDRLLGVLLVHCFVASSKQLRHVWARDMFRVYPSLCGRSRLESQVHRAQHAECVNLPCHYCLPQCPRVSKSLVAELPFCYWLKCLVWISHPLRASQLDGCCKPTYSACCTQQV